VYARSGTTRTQQAEFGGGTSPLDVLGLAADTLVGGDNETAYAFIL
jgi:hypothetical protein